MAQRSFTVGIPEELEGRVVEAARAADITRNAFVRRALEAALGPPVVRERGVPAGEESREPSANFGSHERYGPRRAGKPFQKS